MPEELALAGVPTLPDGPHRMDHEARREAMPAREASLPGRATAERATLLEQNQQKDGSVVVPEALRAFMGTDRLVPGS